MQFRKDVFPSVTIKRIRSILKKNGIKVKEYPFLFNGVFFSFRVVLKDFPSIGANGKGITKELALASAYAEFMERLQSRFLIKPYFTNKVPMKIFFEDEELLDEIKFDEICHKVFSFMSFKKLKEFLETIDYHNNVYRYVMPFTNYFSKTIERLPIRLINAITHSNGLCAGNSFEEAISQGICEIFERYVYKKIMLKRYNPPSISLPEKYKANKLLKEINKLGYSFEIKDCSLNNKFPVLGVLIFNMKKDKFAFALGADIDFEIALQRCLTEIFQGLTSIKDLEAKLTRSLDKKDDVYTNWIKSFVSNNGHIPPSLKKTNSIRKKIPGCFQEVLSNKESFDKLLNIIQVNNFQLYIKDYSYLSFPTYKVYIPGLSEVEEIDNIETVGLRNRLFLNSVFYDIKNASSSELKRFYKIISILCRKEIYQSLNFPRSYFSAYEINAGITKHDFSYLKEIIKHYLSGEKIKEKLPCCPQCNLCKIKCGYKNWEKLNNLLKYKYIGYIINKNLSMKKEIKIYELRADITQCRIIQIDKHLENKHDKI